jgi:acyl carrier protein
MDTKTTVRRFVNENFYIANPNAFADDMSLLDQGVVDSTGILEIVSFLESTFEIQVDDSDLIPENLDSINGIAEFLARKRCRAAS